MIDHHPPRRLTDEPSPDPASGQAWAIDLLRTADPYRAPAGRKQRVRLSLGQAGARRTPLVLRPVIAGIVLIGCGAAASAALGHWPMRVARAYRQLVASPPETAPPEAAPRVHRAAATRSDAVPWGTALPVPAEDPTASGPRSDTVSPIRSSIRSSARSSTRSSVHASGARRSVAMEIASEHTAPVLEAMHVLRVERDPVRARALLTRYLERHPSGTLAEEALAMLIEAAVAHHDGDAVALAREYLERYPSGHFSALASQTLSSDRLSGTSTVAR